MRKVNRSVLDIAEALIYHSNKQKSEITNLRLQKLLYFAEAISLARTGIPLFKDKIEAWNLGPVINNTYHKYKVEELKSSQASVNDLNFSEREKSIVEDTIATFKRYSTQELVDMSHRHLPWKTNYEKGKNKNIPKSEIKKYYQNIFH